MKYFKMWRTWPAKLFVKHRVRALAATQGDFYEVSRAHFAVLRWAGRCGFAFADPRGLRKDAEALIDALGG